MTSSIEQTYVKLSPIEHVLKKPGMYVGDLDFRTEKQLVYSDKKIIQKEISWSPGLYKIVDELIVNSYDQSIRDNKMTCIHANISKDSFSIFNDGMGIDVVRHKEHNIWVPELIFANLLTSTNYSDTEERITGGTHGLGAKLSAIFSKKFIIEVWDSKTKKYYHQIIENNLSKISKPTIEKYNEFKINNTTYYGGVKITIFPDFERFTCSEFSNDMIMLIERRVVDLVGLVKKHSIFLNNTFITTSSFENYLAMYPDENNKWYIGSCVKNPLWAFAIRFEHNTHISFVNGIYTNRGGKHLDYIMDMITEKFKKIVGSEFTKKLLNDYFTICLKVSIVNPTFNSQTKEELNTPINKFGFECNIPDSFYNEIKNSELLDKMKQILLLSSQKILSKLDGSKKSKIKNMPKLDDANYAGTKKSNECTLILTEGDSAKATAISGISAIENGRNYFGVYPLRGKLLNVREASTAQISSNIEITELKKILGLKSGITYTKETLQDLRYGSVLIMTDADEDGSHIKGLIINFFDYFFPSLLHIQGFLKILVTPLVKATYKDTVINFANLRAYKVWKEKTKDNNIFKIKYYKGLGTSSAKEAIEYFKNLEKNTITILGDKTNSDILLAFAKDKVNERKSWLTKYNPENILELEPPQTIDISKFVHMELIHFSNYDNIRSIPSIADGFKPSQRKVLFACLKRNLYTEAKVAQLAASVAELSAYHHGEQSLVATIINMTQNFVGANNMNLLMPIGQLGTRLMGGKDHSSARYIFTCLEKYVPIIFNKIDLELLESIVDDGMLIEPKYYIPIIPMVLINGAEGIGTGFSTFIPNYNMKDIIVWLMNRIQSKKNIKLIPWYKNFTGRIIEYNSDTWLSEGILSIDENKHTITIKELPLKFWTNDYKEFLENLIYETDSLFKSYINLSSDISVNFVLKYDVENKETILKMHMEKDSDNLNVLYKYLKLYKTIKQSNMNLYTTDYKIKTYKNAEEIIEDFYNHRLGFYDKRKELMLQKLKEQLKLYGNMIKFTELVIEMKGKIFTMDNDNINKCLKENKIDMLDNSYDYLLNMTFKQLTKANVEKLEAKVKELKAEYKIIENKDMKTLWLEDLEKLQEIIN